MAHGPTSNAERGWWKSDLWTMCWGLVNGFVTGVMVLAFIWSLALLSLIDEKLSAQQQPAKSCPADRAAERAPPDAHALCGLREAR